MRPVRFIRDEHDCRTWALEQGLTMSREAFGAPPEQEPQRCPVCDGEWHTEDCIFGKEVARRLKAERDLAGWREMALSQSGDSALLARAMKAETENALLHEAMRDEIDEGLRLRELGGALPDENITAMTERVIRERAALEAKCTRLQGLLDACHKICGELARPSGI